MIRSSSSSSFGTILAGSCDTPTAPPYEGRLEPADEAPVAGRSVDGADAAVDVDVGFSDGVPFSDGAVEVREATVGPTSAGSSLVAAGPSVLAPVSLLRTTPSFTEVAALSRLSFILAVLCLKADVKSSRNRDILLPSVVCSTSEPWVDEVTSAEDAVTGTSDPGTGNLRRLIRIKPLHWVYGRY
uniref:Uncharacterized protein n=1 Tax=Anopheles atroparvus TaxID=41427 RepID=A0A182JDZ2_ANOAO